MDCFHLGRKDKDTAPECLQSCWEVWETSIQFSELKWSRGQPKIDKINPPWWSLRDIQLLLTLPGNQIPREGLELLGSADGPDEGRRAGKAKIPHPQPHTHLECPSAGRLPKSLLGEQRRVWDDRHFKQQKSWRGAIRKTIGMGKGLSGRQKTTKGKLTSF